MFNSDNNNKVPFEIPQKEIDKIKRQLGDKKSGVTILNVFAYPAKKLQKRYHVRYKFNKKHLLLDLILVGAVLFMLSTIFFYWWGGFHYFEDNFDMSVQTSSEQVTAGQQTSYIIEYANNNNFDIALGTLTVVFPSDFTLTDASRSDFNWQTNTLFVGNLAPGANGRLVLTGQAFGQINSQQELVANFTYYKTNKTGVTLWGQFQEIEKTVYQITDSALDVSIGLPDKLVNLQTFTLPITVVNNFDQTLDEVKIQIQPQSNLEVVEIDENYINDAWYIYQLDSLQQKVLLPKVKMNTEQLSQEVAIDVFIKKDNQYIKQYELIERLDLFDPQFEISQQVSADNVQAGEWVDVAVNLKNNNGYNIENVVLTVDLAGEYWDLQQISGQDFVKENNSFVLTSENYSRLALISPQSFEVVNFKVKTKAAQGSSPQVAIQTTVDFDIDENKVTFISDENIIKISSNIAAKAYARFYTAEGEQLGRGALPPQVGQTTNYWVFIQVLNDVNALNNVKIAADLADNVVWQNNTVVPVGPAISYANNHLDWQISKVSKDPQNVGIAFEVALTPSAAQQGQIVDLIKNITVSGNDSNTGQYISYQVSAVTTDLQYDQKAAATSPKVQ